MSAMRCARCYADNIALKRSGTAVGNLHALLLSEERRGYVVMVPQINAEKPHGVWTLPEFVPPDPGIVRIVRRALGLTG